MANHVVLNNEQHKDLKIITERSERYGDSVMCSLTFPDEYRSIQAHYPIFFRKDSGTGEFHSVAMFGFEENENLFLKGQEWDAAYLPLTIERQPFLIGFQSQTENGQLVKQPVVHIDLDNPRVSTTEGEPVFLEHGGYAPFLDRINSVLKSIHDGFEGLKPFVEALLRYDLLESFTLDVELNDGSKYHLAGFYTINEEKLHGLPGDALSELNQAGHLAAIFMVLASMSQLRGLIERRNELLAAGN